MQKILLSKKAIDLAINFNASYQSYDIILNKFCNIIKKEYPNISYNDCEVKFEFLRNRNKNIKSILSRLEDKRISLLENSLRYQRYKIFNEYNEMHNCKVFFDIGVESYNSLVDSVRELGYNESYFESNINQIKQINHFNNKTQIEANISGLIFTIVIFAIFGLLYYTCMTY
jgi:hypothetical protein